MDDFFIIPLLLAKKNFFPTPLLGAALLGEGESAFFFLGGGGLFLSDQNETFHSLFLCYPATFGKKKRESEFFFSPKVAG